MKTLHFTMTGGADLVARAEEDNAETVDLWGVLTLRWTLGTGDPVEGVVLGWENRG